MADGFTELEERIMAVLVKERKTAAHTIADANEIAGFLKQQVRDLEETARDARLRIAKADELLEHYTGTLWTEETRRAAAEVQKVLLGASEKRVEDKGRPLAANDAERCPERWATFRCVLLPGHPGRHTDGAGDWRSVEQITPRIRSGIGISLRPGRR